MRNDGGIDELKVHSTRLDMDTLPFYTQARTTANVDGVRSPLLQQPLKLAATYLVQNSFHGLITRAGQNGLVSAVFVISRTLFVNAPWSNTRGSEHVWCMF
ncbi:hypothetical protein P879_04081 [Paragonimus westermani]|uniref:Uncharacterized protein n=1 Tax=Paragonimus westermani TaxID=34504 RepID=A0A8T0DIV9_9TREM|nr:hypothetical protein P879_04081 [Paragonimus westermani]